MSALANDPLTGREGELICEVEAPSPCEADVTLPEGKLERKEVGQRVRLKARALPYETHQARVTSVARAADPSETKGDTNTVTISCAIEDPPSVLRASMGSHTRIVTGRRPIRLILLDRALRLLRTVFSW